MSISVSARHRLGSFSLDAHFEATGPLTAIFGASGSGKTSLVNVIAGLITPQDARVIVDGEVLIDTAQRSALPAHRRRIGYVFQDARLFPHLSVNQNLRYGRWFAPPKQRYADFDQITALLGIGTLLERKSGQLSGGEKQRVAIGRALLASPRLLLMDEPLASLDQARKAEIMPYIERLRDELRIPIIYVSHSVAEVARLASDIVVMANGRVMATGPAKDIMQRLDLVPDGERDEGGAILDMQVISYDKSFDMTLLRSPGGDIYVQGNAGEPGKTIRIRIRARDVMIATALPQHISALNILRGSVLRIDQPAGASVNVAIDCAGTTLIARITRQSAAVLNLQPGLPVYAVMKAVSIASAQ